MKSVSSFRVSYRERLPLWGQTLARRRFEVVLVDDMSPKPLEGVVERVRWELGLNSRYARTMVRYGAAPARELVARCCLGTANC